MYDYFSTDESWAHAATDQADDGAQALPGQRISLQLRQKLTPIFELASSGIALMFMLLLHQPALIPIPLLLAAAALNSHRRRRVRSLGFSKSLRRLRFDDGRGNRCILDYGRVLGFERSWIRGVWSPLSISGNKHAVYLNLVFSNGLRLSLFSQRSQAIEALCARLSERAFGPSLEVQSADAVHSEPTLAQLRDRPVWLRREQGDAGLVYRWHSQQSWGVPLVWCLTGIWIGWLCFAAGAPLSVWGLFPGLTTLLLWQTLRTRRRGFWVSFEGNSLHWGNRAWLGGKDRIAGTLAQAQELHWYWHSEYGLIALNAAGEAELQRKRPKNTGLSVNDLLATIREQDRLRIPLPGFSLTAALWLHQHLEAARTSEAQSCSTSQTPST